MVYCFIAEGFALLWEEGYCLTQNGVSGRRLPTLALILVSVVWGAGFMGVQIALDSGFPPGLILVLRFFIAAAVLAGAGAKHVFPLTKQEMRYGAWLGALLAAGYFIQTTGLRLTTPSNNGFFTATNVIMVPFVCWAFYRKKPPLKLFACCLLAVVGFFVLSWAPGAGFSVNLGDVLTLVGAFFFAWHISSLGNHSAEMDPTKLTFLQMIFAGGFSLIPLAFSDFSVLARADWMSGLLAVLFLGLMSTCLCSFLQTWAQARTSPGKAAVIMACESLWCMVFSVMLGYERFTVQMVAGGLIIVGAVCLLELEPPRRKKSEEGDGEDEEAVVAEV